MRRTVAVAVLVASAATSSLVAQTPEPQTPIVRVEVEPDTVRVGEALDLRITVLAPTWFPSPPRFPEFELANAVTRLPPDSSRPTSSRVGSMSWSGIVRDYEVYPLIAATYRLTDQVVTVTYADPQTRRPTRVEVAVPEIEFRAEVPEGAEGLDPYLAGSSLTLSRVVDGEVEGLEAGDALVVRTTAELDGLPAMFLPTLVGEPDIEGASVYAAQPVVEDDGIARRTEKVTLVFEAGGEFALPELELQWWNTATGQVETATAPAVTVEVAGPVVTAPPVEEEAPAPRDWRPWLAVVAAVVALVLALRRWGPTLQAWFEERRRRRLQSEEHAFNLVRAAIRSGDAREVHHAMLRWLARLAPPMDAATFAATYGDERLRFELEALSRALYSGRGGRAPLGGLGQHLAAARGRRHDALTGGGHYSLPPMNP